MAVHLWASDAGSACANCHVISHNQVNAETSCDDDAHRDKDSRPNPNACLSSSYKAIVFLGNTYAVGHATGKNSDFHLKVMDETQSARLAAWMNEYSVTNYPAFAKNGKTRRKQDGELVKGLHEPIIDDELFDKCHKIRAERRRQQNSNQTTRRVYLLSGIITCQECGRRMRAQSAHSCRYWRESARFSGIECQHHGKSVKADQAEAKISELFGKPGAA